MQRFNIKIHIKVSWVFLCILSCKENSHHINHSEIDQLKSSEDVQSLIRKTNSTFEKYKVKRIKDFNREDFLCKENIALADQLDVSQSFYKTDFDNNGFTDLLVIGDKHNCLGMNNESCSYSPVVLLNFGNRKYALKDISQGFDDYYVPKIKKVNNKNLLEIYKPVVKDWEKKTFGEPLKQTLVFKEGEFVEYNSNDKNYIPVQKIEFSTSGCYGTCPVFQLSIDQNRNAHFIAEHFNFSENTESWSENIEGKFHAVIDEKQYENLIGTLQYIDFPNLEDNYAVDWTDDQTVTLKITYAGNKVKVIQDYGAQGTYGLKSIYKKLFELRKNQKWKKDEGLN